MFIFYGVIMGIGLNRLSDAGEENLMLVRRQGLATGIAVAGFGLAKAIQPGHAVADLLPSDWRPCSTSSQPSMR